MRGSLLPAILCLSATGLCGGCGPRTEADGRSLSLAVLPAPGNPSRVTVELPAGAAYSRIERASGKLEEVFYLTLDQGKSLRSGDTAGHVPILARTELDPKRRVVVLRPQASLTPGLTYAAVFNGPALSPELPYLARGYTVPREDRKSDARVAGIYPGQAVVPANLLKFYVYFSRPMAEGKTFQFVRLLDGAGKPVPQAFREVELWGEDHRRLTLWINPGRTKHALGLSESLGPVLQEARRYTLEVRAGMPDSRGRPLAVSVRHPFRTAGWDRTQPRVSGWKIGVPKAGSREPLRVRFAEPLDRALATSSLRVEGGGVRLAGREGVDRDSRVWSFQPEGTWKPGSYRLVAAGDLEDLAGNSLYRPFETRETAGQRPSVEIPEYPLPFQVR